MDKVFHPDNERVFTGRHDPSLEACGSESFVVDVERRLNLLGAHNQRGNHVDAVIHHKGQQLPGHNLTLDPPHGGCIKRRLSDGVRHQIQSKETAQAANISDRGVVRLESEKTGAEVTSFYIDMRTPSKGYEEFYHRLLEEGMRFVRGKVAEVTDAARMPGEEGMLIVQAEDTLLGRQRRIPVDMVVLMSAFEPRHDAYETGLKAHISCSSAGWYNERHPKLDPVATMTEGVFVAGACQGPKDIPASVVQGAAAAARVQAMISKGVVEIEPVVAAVTADTCSGCRICNTLCPFGAIHYLSEPNVSEIETALCKGCGTCVAACPAGAITGAHFGDHEILAEIEGLLLDALPAA